MAVTNVAHKVGQLLQTSKFAVTADNDEIIPAGREQIVVGAFFEGLATALNIDSGLDITEFPFQVGLAETVNVTTTGAGEVTILFATLPKEGYPTFTA